MSIWGHAPQYVGDVDPKTAYQLLYKAKAMMDIEIDLEELRMEGNLFQKQLDSLMKQDSGLSQLVHTLEIEYKNSKRKPDYLI
jgi:proteasome assembly chaperone (PAC2) family protein